MESSSSFEAPPDGALHLEQSGPRPTVHEPEAGPAARAELAIQQSNRELREATDAMLELPVVMLARQRDAALTLAEDLRFAADRAREALLEEQDRFIAYLMAEHEKNVADLTAELGQARERAERLEVLRASAPSADQAGTDVSGAAEERILVLQEQLEDAYREIDEARSIESRLQEERDEAIRAIDDARQEAYDELESARDEANRLQLQVDELNRRLDDERDIAREEAYRLNEQIDSARRELDERHDEVRRLRERLAEATHESQRYSQPPPPDSASELEDARTEAKLLRKQLIDAKRELSRAAQDLELLRNAYRRDSRAGMPAVPAPRPEEVDANWAPSSSRSGEPARSPSRSTPRTGPARIGDTLGTMQAVAPKSRDGVGEEFPRNRTPPMPLGRYSLTEAERVERVPPSSRKGS